jgi:hypothetical protein
MDLDAERITYDLIVPSHQPGHLHQPDAREARRAVTKGGSEGYGTNQGELPWAANTQVHLCRGRATTSRMPSSSRSA